MVLLEAAIGLVLILGLILVIYQLHALKRRQPEMMATTQRIRELEDLLGTIPDPLLIIDRDGNCLEEYPASDKTRARSVISQASTEEQDAFQAKLQTAIDQGIRVHQPLHHDGSTLLADIWPLSATGKKPTAAAVCLRDVTDLEHSANQVDTLAARNQAILRSAMDGFFIVGEDYRFLEVNEAFCRMIGYSADELLRMKITELEIKEPARGLGDSSPLRTGLHQFATAHRHRDGHVIRLETSVIVLRDHGQKILVGFARDVTERIRSEEALERLSRQNKLILDSAAEGIYGVDTQGRFTFANPAAARMLERDVNEMIGQMAHELMQHGQGDSRIHGSADCRVCRAMHEDVVQHIGDETFHRRDGGSFPVEFVSSPIREHGELTGTVVVFRDISERRRAEEERCQLEVRFQQTQKLESLGILAGGLAHDFNNLLLSILCNASLATEHLPTESKVRKQLEKILKAGRRASELTRQMLAYSGQASYDVQTLELNELVSEVVDFMHAALPKLVTLHIELEPELPLIKADNAQLQQVIMNLLINAAEAVGDRSGDVTVSTLLFKLGAEQFGHNFVGYDLPPGEYVGLCVRDSGCGMSPETQARIFDPFFTTKSTGRGLGLSALLGIVRAHRGAVRVHSREQHGTRFTVLFPAAADAVHERLPQQPPTTLRADATVLVVDDEEDIRDVVQAVLESRGMRVLLAEDGPQGVACFRDNADDVDVVLLDMTMPGMSGEEVFRQIVAMRPDARVILSSGYSEQESLARLEDGRLAGFVHKPYTAQVLLSQIGAAIQKPAGTGVLVDSKMVNTS
ncbi:MAG: PAS domain S-box protein [Planctomycetota bacterium]